MEGWDSGRVTHKVVTRQPWIRRRSGKVRQLQTDVLTTEPHRQPKQLLTGPVCVIQLAVRDRWLIGGVEQSVVGVRINSSGVVEVQWRSGGARQLAATAATRQSATDFCAPVPVAGAGRRWCRRRVRRRGCRRRVRLHTRRVRCRRHRSPVRTAGELCRESRISVGPKRLRMISAFSFCGRSHLLVCLLHWFPVWVGVSCPNWVMNGASDLGNGLFFLLVFQPQRIYFSKKGRFFIPSR